MKHTIPLLTALLLAPLAMLYAAGKKGEDLSMSSPSATDAKCAFARMLEEGTWNTPAGLSQVESFAAREGMFFPAAHLVTYYADVPAVVEALLNRPAPISKQLAAAIQAFAALGDCLEAEKSAELRQVVPEELGEAAEEPGKKKFGGKKKRAKASTSLPVALFADKSVATLELAILAAAYAADGGVKAQVDAVPGSPNSGIAGAKLLYYARTGAPVAEEQVAAAFAPAKHAAGYLTTASPELANFNLLLPKEAYACEALGLLKDNQYLGHLHRMLGHPDLRVQMEVVRALRKIAARESLPFLVAKLNTCEWPVLVDLCQALATMPSKEAVPPLLARLKKETGRFRLDVTYALSAIAGEQIGQEYKEWETWWSKNGAEFQVDEAASKAFRGKRRVQDIRVPDLGFFYSLRIYSDHFCYVVDSSNSMKGDRMENLRSNLNSSLDSLRPWVNFSLTDFGGVVSTMLRDGLTKDKHKGKVYAREMTHSLGTRVYDALEESAGIKGVDTLLLLTDGMPVRGQINPWVDLYRAMTIMNRYRQLTISTVAFQPTERAESALKKMAYENLGQSVITN